MNYQADNLAKLWQEFLSVIEPIAKIFGAVAEQERATLTETLMYTLYMS